MKFYTISKTKIQYCELFTLILNLWAFLSEPLTGVRGGEGLPPARSPKGIKGAGE